MRTVMMYVGSFLLGFGMRSTAMDHASSMNQFYWDELPPEFHAEVQEQEEEQKKPFRWEDCVSDSESETEDKKTASPLEFEIVGLAELEKKHEQEMKQAVPVGDEESDASSSFEQDYVQQGMRMLSLNKGRRVLAQYKALTVQTANGDELQIFDGQNLVYEGTGCRATHAAFSPTHDKVTAACREVDGQLFLLTISVPNTPSTSSITSRPQEIFHALPLVTLGKDKVAISDVGELAYLSENKIQVSATACRIPVQESDDESSE